MRFILLGVGFVAILLFLGQNFITSIFKDDSNFALLLSGFDKKSIENTILRHYRTEILKNQNALSDKNTYTLNQTFVDINQDRQNDIVAIIDSAETCGSGGCIATIFIQNEFKEFVPINFMYAVKKIEVLDGITKGMHDLRLNGDLESRLSWNGKSYVLEQI